MVPWQLVGFLISLIARKVQRKKKKKISGIVALCGAGRALRCCQLELLFVCSCYTLESSVSGQVLLCWLFSVQPTSTTPSGRFRVNIREQKEWLGSGTAGQGAVGSPSMEALRAVGMWHLGVRLVGMAGWAGVGLCYDSMALWSAWVSEQLPLLCREGSGAAGGLSAPRTGSSNAAHWAALRSSWALEQAVRLLHGVLVTAWLDPNKCHFSWCLLGGRWWKIQREGCWHGVLSATSGLADLVWSQWAVPMTSEPGCSAYWWAELTCC